MFMWERIFSISFDIYFRVGLLFGFCYFFSIVIIFLVICCCSGFYSYICLFRGGLVFE